MDKPSLLTAITNAFGYGYSESQSSSGLPNSTHILPDPVEPPPEESVQSSTEINPHEAASLEAKDFSLATAQWTPDWPSNLVEALKSNDGYSNALPLDDVIQIPGSQSLFPKEQLYNRGSAQWTPQWPEDFLETRESESSGSKIRSGMPSGGPSLNLTPDSNNSSHFTEDLEPGIDSFDGSIMEVESLEAAEETNESSCSGSRTKWPTEVTREESNTSVVTGYSNLDSSMLDHETKKWIIELGSNRNYIKALVNRSSADWASVAEMNVHNAVDIDGGAKKSRWVINYDNLNYIRSQINPDVLEKLLREKLERSIVEKKNDILHRRKVNVN